MGQDFLQATDAFIKHKSCFHDVTTDDDSLGLSLVVWKEKKPKQASQSEFTNAFNFISLLIDLPHQPLPTDLRPSSKRSKTSSSAELRITKRSGNSRTMPCGKRRSETKETASRIGNALIPIFGIPEFSPRQGSQPTLQRFVGTQLPLSGSQKLRSELGTALVPGMCGQSLFLG